ncbi:hypothetical protein PHYBOEH_010805 [Phytophthora boehmeriae]|uniref:Uncharacterized protein n=1 Tax=Phytophthora boehmeriae TaxID=109152 RepID=A0A8T1VNI4_9STRA|nr:hypothetical protein PHYBOEH_010805 [Phytophthora boehmeriae]
MSSAAKQDKVTVFVATCQIMSDDANVNADKSGGNVATPVFKSEKFPAVVSLSAKMEDLQRFIVDQWTISSSPFAKLPLAEHFYTFKGRILRLDGTLDAYYILENDTVYLRFASLGKICDPWAMSTSELRAELKNRNAYEINLQPEQLNLDGLRYVVKMDGKASFDYVAVKELLFQSNPTLVFAPL